MLCVSKKIAGLWFASCIFFITSSLCFFNEREVRINEGVVVCIKKKNEWSILVYEMENVGEWLVLMKTEKRCRLSYC